MMLTARKRVQAPPALSAATEAAIAHWIIAPPPLSSSSSSEYSSSSLSGSSSSAPASPYSGPSPSLLLSPSVVPYRKRCRSLTSPLPRALAVATSLLPTDLSPPHIALTRLETSEHELEILRARLVSSKREIAALHARVTAAEHRITELLDSRYADRLEMTELQSRAPDAEAQLWLIERQLGLP
ncbi:hypothetical protein Tco_0441985 [Tanacetum coccineum]